MKAAYGLGYLASLTHTGNKTRDVDYSEQAREDFAWYAQMDDAQLQDALQSMPRRRMHPRPATQFKHEILRLWRECPTMTQREIAQRTQCHPTYVNKVVREARA